jgi:hypothetical protein
LSSSPTTRPSPGSAWSTLSGNGGSIASGATSLKVASNTPYPAANPTKSPPTQFRVRIDNELFIVTDNRTITWTVTPGAEGSTQAGHNDGATVTHVLTSDIVLKMRRMGSMGKLAAWVAGVR